MTAVEASVVLKEVAPPVELTHPGPWQELLEGGGLDAAPLPAVQPPNQRVRLLKIESQPRIGTKAVDKHAKASSNRGGLRGL